MFMFIIQFLGIFVAAFVYQRICTGREMGVGSSSNITFLLSHLTPSSYVLRQHPMHWAL